MEVELYVFDVDGNFNSYFQISGVAKVDAQAASHSAHDAASRILGA